LRAFLRAPGGIIGATIFSALIVLAIIGPVIWGEQAKVTNLAIAYPSSSAAHPLGTDSLGRDILARTLSATRLTLELGFFAAAISAILGFGVGTIVASLGPRLRGIGRRVIEISMSFPPILLALFLVTIIGAGAKGAVIAIGVMLLLPLFLWDYRAGSRTNWDAATLGAVAYFAIFPSVLAYFSSNAAVARVGAERAATFIHLMPVFGAALASAFLGEALLWYHFAGALLIFSGIFAASRSA